MPWSCVVCMNEASEWHFICESNIKKEARALRGFTRVKYLELFKVNGARAICVKQFENVFELLHFAVSRKQP